MTIRTASRCLLCALLVALGAGEARAQGVPPPPADPDAPEVPPPPPAADPGKPPPAPGPAPGVVVPPAAPGPPPPGDPGRPPGGEGDAPGEPGATSPSDGPPTGRVWGAPDRGPRRAPKPPRFHLAYWGVSGGALIPLKGKGVYRDLGSGFTFGSTFGLNFGPSVALEMSLWGSGHPDPNGHSDAAFPLALLFAQADLRWNLTPAGSGLVPYLLAGVGVGALLDKRVGIFDQDDVVRTAVGGNLRAAFGLDFRPSRSSLIGVRLGLQNLLFSSPEGGSAISCGDSYLLALAAEAFLAVRF